MSLNYTTLQSTVLAEAVHAELTTEVVDFVRKCEAMIRRKVFALELRSTLDETDRNTAGIYNLSGQVLELRRVYTEDAPNGANNVGVVGIRSLPADAPVTQYAVSGQTIELRGVPGTDAEIELLYKGWPDPLSVTATNELLTNHEDIYVCGSLFYLYKHTQDLELAQSELSTFTEAVDALNKATARLQGGGSVQPAYNFGQRTVGRGY